MTTDCASTKLKKIPCGFRHLKHVIELNGKRNSAMHVSVAPICEFILIDLNDWIRKCNTLTKGGSGFVVLSITYTVDTALCYLSNEKLGKDKDIRLQIEERVEIGSSLLTLYIPLSINLGHEIIMIQQYSEQ